MFAELKFCELKSLRIFRVSQNVDRSCSRKIVAPQSVQKLQIIPAWIFREV